MQERARGARMAGIGLAWFALPMFPQKTFAGRCVGIRFSRLFGGGSGSGNWTGAQQSYNGKRKWRAPRAPNKK